MMPQVWLLTLAALFVIASFTCMLERQPFVATYMAFTSVLLVGTVALTV